jgi:hypothetical protein
MVSTRSKSTLTLPFNKCPHLKEGFDGVESRLGIGGIKDGFHKEQAHPPLPLINVPVSSPQYGLDGVESHLGIGSIEDSFHEEQAHPPLPLIKSCWHREPP